MKTDVRYKNLVQGLITSSERNRGIMDYFFSQHVEELKIFYAKMREINVRIGTFSHSYNEINSEVIFDTRNAWKLVFMKKGYGDVLEIPIEIGYLFTIRGNEAYKKFINYFGVSGKKGEFKMGEFIAHFKKFVPDKYVLDDSRRDTILSYDKIDGKSDGKYPIRVINWEVVHAKNPTLDDEKYHRSPENLEKTRELYPELYSKTKDMDLTIVYGLQPEEKTSELKKGIID